MRQLDRLDSMGKQIPQIGQDPEHYLLKNLEISSGILMSLRMNAGQPLVSARPQNNDREKGLLELMDLETLVTAGRERFTGQQAL